LTEPRLRLSNPGEAVLLIELDRPDRHNAVDAEMVAQLLEAFDEPPVRFVILASHRRGQFCSGADVTISDAERIDVSDRLHQLYERMIATPAVIIAAVGGPAVGGGAQLAMASDVRIVAPNASFRFVGAGNGLAVGAWVLPSLVGRGVAFELCTSMRAVGAEEAVRIGLATSIADDPAAAALELSSHLAALDTAALARIKRLINGADLLEALRAERDGNRQTWDGRPPPAG
jgi:enoyl-CoA hydratase/carnithine racemase